VDNPDCSRHRPATDVPHSYKTVSSDPINAAILLPKNLQPGLHPVIVNIHGGFFATGHSLFAPWFRPWLLKLALDHNAIIVSADYRLLPTPNGIADQLADLEDFWQWFRGELPALLESRGVKMDIGRLLLVGGSAGGYYAAQLALSRPDEIAALALTYPAVDLKDDIFVDGPAEGNPTVLHFPASEILPLSESLAWVKQRREIVASKGGFEITPYCVSLAQHECFSQEMFEYDTAELGVAELPLERIRAGGRLPRNL